MVKLDMSNFAADADFMSVTKRSMKKLAKAVHKSDNKKLGIACSELEVIQCAIREKYNANVTFLILRSSVCMVEGNDVYMSIPI